MEISKKAFARDILINMFATAIPIAVLNVVVYPLLAFHVSTNNYGTLTACVGLINFVNGIWGSSVAYTRLLDKTEGIIKKNYSMILSVSLVGAVLMNMVMLWVTGCMLENISVWMLSLCTVLIILNNYMIVEYRLILSYNKILLSNIFNSVGYCVGFSVLALTGYVRWEWVFVFGYGFAVIFNLFTTSIWKGLWIKDSKFQRLAKDTGILVVTSSISGTSTYLDKLLVYPLLGATIMAYYQTASIIAKVIPLFAAAISNVILSYLVQINVISKGKYWMYIGILIVISVIGVIICNVVVPPVIKFLYPKYYEHCLSIIPYANIIAILQMFYSFVFPLSLRYAKRSKQYSIQLGRLIPYVILALIFIKLNGLVGFCYATIISQIIQILLVMVISLKAIKRKDNDEFN